MIPDALNPDPRPETPDTGAADAWPTPSRFALILAVLLAVTFWRVLFGGEAFFYRDYGFLGYPFAHFHRECFWSGDFFPLWNPYVNCGAPFLAQWNTQTLYPGSLIYLLLPLPWSLGFFCVAHLFLGGVGMRALAERWAGSRFGAAVAGVAFVFSGLVLGCTIYPNYLVALGWMPWVALATRRAWQEGGRSIVLAALAGAMQMLSGAPEIILLTWGFLAALLLTEVFSVQCSVFSKGTNSSVPSRPPEAKTEHWIRNTEYLPPLRRFLAVIALVSGLCAAQLLPFFQLLSLSQRSGDAVNTFWSLAGWGWVNLFFPLFMNFQTDQGVFVMISQAFFPSVYLGIVPLTLALLAVWRIGLRRAEEPAVVGRGVLTPPSATHTPQDLGGALGTARPTNADSAVTAVWEVRLLAGATLLAVLLAMGDNFVLWGWLREVLPLGVVRFPVKALLLAAFTVPLLAALGVAEFEARLRAAELDISCDSKRLPRILEQCLMAGTALGALGVLLLKVNTHFPVLTRVSSDVQSSIAGCIAVLAFAAAVMVVPQFRGTRPLSVAVKLTLLLLVAAHGVLHLNCLNPTIPASAFEPGLASAYHASKNTLTPAPKLGESRIMLSPLAERALHTRMVPKFYDDFIGQRLAFWGNLNLLDGLPKVNGASTLVTREWNDVEYFLYGTTNPAPANLIDFLGVTHTTKPGELMQWERRETAMPLVSAGQKPVDYPHHPDRRLPFAADWDPREVVFVEHQRGGIYAESRVPVKVLAVRFTAERVEADVEAAERSVVVIAQNDYPNWRATVNSNYTRMERANHAFQAIPIPAGKSIVRLDYVDWPFRIGAGISLMTLLGCALLWRRGH